MGALGGIAKTLGKYALPLLGVGGSALGALGGSGNQGGSTSNQQQDSTQDSYNEFNQSGTNESLPIEDPRSYAFRGDLYKRFGNAWGQAGKPVFGEGEKASYLNDLNDLAKTAMGSLQGKLSGQGALDSGALNAGVQDIEMGKFGQYADFLSKLPAMNRQYADNQRNTLMGLGNTLAGIAPVGQRGTFNQSGTSKGNTKTSSTMTGSTQQQGPGFWKGFAGNLGSLGGMAFGNLMANGGFGGGGNNSSAIRRLPTTPKGAFDWRQYAPGGVISPLEGALRGRY